MTGRGITGISITPDLARELGLASENGILIVEVFSDSPADHAGIRGGDRELIAGSLGLRIGGDVITGVNGHGVSSMKDLIDLLNRSKVGEVLILDVMRNGVPREVEVILAERP